MKKIFFVLATLIIISIYLKSYNTNPYAGSYKSASNNIILLSSNNKCTIINSSYKEAFYIKCKYVVKNNNIKIMFDSDKENYYEVSSLKGEFQGSRIKIYNPIESNYCYYMKE
ncbi:hypothetical protein SAMN02745134_01940 [Clostridium acidisoli DSM 12555]|jgi:hypothetical protein|uniref:Uncharacterized protein n=1 Tax=Clostridium acidisoli DSM 12555 TaxID=1121291 RepID=A0A1W1XIA5_9CLOT|nr:hypothetical protein [Clostridium acidisoli]SMC23504.1 hypothetical protein SAMN02745134_01940 [Clostridium acidisoli DSM 12555]